jgi:hypothetical protein
MQALDALDALTAPAATEATIARRIKDADKLSAALSKAARACGYQLDKLEAATRG